MPARADLVQADLESVHPRLIHRGRLGDELAAKAIALDPNEQIKNSPEYDPARPVDRTYEAQLYGHYGQPRYWGG